MFKNYVYLEENKKGYHNVTKQKNNVQGIFKKTSYRENYKNMFGFN